MPKSLRPAPLRLALIAALLGSSLAQANPVPPTNSELDAPLFYQLLVGEMELRSGQPGVAFQVLLDAARRTGDEALFRRVVDIALQARAGDQALTAARAWRESVPESVEAQQMTLQLVTLLNRPADITAPLRSLLNLTPEDKRAGVLASLPRLFQRSPEPRKVLEAVEPLLQEQAREPATRLIALLVNGRLASVAEQHGRALELVRQAAKAAPNAEEPALLALELMQAREEAEGLVADYLKGHPDAHSVRQAYGRALARSQRSADAAREFRMVTQRSPELPSAWYALGALELDLRHPEAAELALNEFIKRIEQLPADKDFDTQEALQQAWLQLAQAAEMRGDFKAAETWLAKVDNPQRSTETTYRRASLLARQGKLDQARKLIQAQAETREEDGRNKLVAEAQLLREAQQWKQAYEVLEQANQRFENDVDLIYEQSMAAEKLGRLEQMEALLRRVIALKPEHYHAYNALGYALADRKERLAEARELIAKALQYAPNEPFIVDSMGWVEYRLGNHEAALKLLRQAYQSRPDAEIAAHLGEVLWINQQQDEARRVWAEGSKRDPGNEALRETQLRLKAKP
ncbi:tetratricopeptide repeat protein [Pelomonas sp. SE-A7]|uniref:tetratricopeptide repeat protein n=1 Tax=Pelomonas sp. SE-A7 TaxID=3054953 RepID=UPI00259CD782|nr:tetratricopeptide repeat protein [Pelomonas sp. SE-A7]MDM4766385.1 tetratricopeptide repeat protein [Pelomonas sp. SE-A7]